MRPRLRLSVCRGPPMKAPFSGRAAFHQKSQARADHHRASLCIRKGDCMGNAIELKDITKTFGEVVANNKVQLTVREGRFWPCWGGTAVEDHADEHAFQHLLPGRRSDPHSRQGGHHPLSQGRV